MFKGKIPLKNREISWLSFNNRVLQEACDPTVPLIERIRFLAIFSSNLDEFFRVRVATLNRLAKLKGGAKLYPGFNIRKTLSEIHEIVRKQQELFEDIFNNRIIPELADEKIFMITDKQLNVGRGQFVRHYFQNKILSTLVPIMLDGLNGFPELKEESLYLFVNLSMADGSLKSKKALIELPTNVHPRFIVLPETGDLKYIILLDDVIRYCLDDIFFIFQYDQYDSYTIKLNRDSEVDLDSDVSLNLVDNIAKSLKQRKKGIPVRFVYDASMPDDLLTYLVRKIGLKTSYLIPGGKYKNFKDFMD